MRLHLEDVLVPLLHLYFKVLQPFAFFIPDSGHGSQAKRQLLSTNVHPIAYLLLGLGR